MSFFGALFDMSFSEFVTLKLIKVLYIFLLCVIGIALVVGVLGGLATMFNRGGFLTGLATVVVAPIGALIYVILVRMWMEIVIVLFRIAEDTSTIARNLKSGE